MVRNTHHVIDDALPECEKLFLRYLPGPQLPHERQVDRLHEEDLVTGVVVHGCAGGRILATATTLSFSSIAANHVFKPAGTGSGRRASHRARGRVELENRQLLEQTRQANWLT